MNHAGLDRVDQRVLTDVMQRTATAKGSKTGLPGIIDSQSDVGGWPELRSAEPPLDTDKDGLPDTWEQHHKLDPNFKITIANLKCKAQRGHSGSLLSRACTAETALDFQISNFGLQNFS